MFRIFILVGCWFVVWIGIGVAFGIFSNGVDGLFSGAMNGAWIATLTSFAWPWIMPRAIRRWVDGRTA